MTKTGIMLDIPEHGRQHITRLLTDFTGTLSRGGIVTEDVKQRLCRIAQLLDIHVITADTFGVAHQQLNGLPVKVLLLEGDNHSEQKRDYGAALGLRHCAVFGNGNNDRLLLEATREAGGISVAVDNGEGCATQALLQSNIFVTGTVNALDLLLDARACKATLRY